MDFTDPVTTSCKKGGDNVHAVIMTGGKGTRLAPYTKVLPKGLLPIGSQPMLEIIVKQLHMYGFTNITMACGYMANLIQTYFGDGSRFGVTIQYVVEDTTLGTVGALKIVPELADTFLVMNCDVLTTLDLRDFAQFHRAGSSMLTIASQQRSMPIRLGVLRVKQDKVIDFVEKPVEQVCVSMGMYMMNREVIDCIPNDKYFDVPDLVRRVLARNLPVRHYENKAYWSDIGTYEDYVKACDEFDEIEPLLFSGGN